MFFMVWQCVAYDTWDCSSKFKATLKGQLKTIVLCICLDLSVSYVCSFCEGLQNYLVWMFRMVCRPEYYVQSYYSVYSVTQFVQSIFSRHILYLFIFIHFKVVCQTGARSITWSTAVDHKRNTDCCYRVEYLWQDMKRQWPSNLLI